jgi:hypothetical protein
MGNRTTVEARQAAFLTAITHQMTALAERLSQWVVTDAPTLTLTDLETQVVASIKELGNALLMGLCGLLTPQYLALTVPCACGAQAAYLRDRPAQVLTVLGPLTITRPIYHCATCHHGVAPLDHQLQYCAGSVSAGLEELLALLGLREDSFDAAVPVLEKLTLLTTCPTSVRAASERLGAGVAVNEQQEHLRAADAPTPAMQPDRPVATKPARIYISMDGTMVHTHDGWKEVKLGAVYTTRTVMPQQRPETLLVRTVAPSFVADIAPPETFGPLLWAEAVRRGVTDRTEVVAIGDGAHWIWNLVAEHFPGAVEIVDWYHASSYVWKVAHSVYGEGSDLAKQWANVQLNQLWDGKASAVVEAFALHACHSAAVREAISYFTNNQGRMDYGRYRAAGMQIGSGTIESGCKHVIGARLKLAGMIWDIAGARAVAKGRARLKSNRWEETIAQRAPLRRSYQRRLPAAAAAANLPDQPPSAQPMPCAA